MTAKTCALIGLFGVAGLAACASGPSRGALKTMPSPDGCFVQVWDEPRFAGRSDFINGPRRYEDLRDMPGRVSWKSRIRSVRLGPGALAIAWSDERFEGRSVLMTSDTLERGAFPTLSLAVDSFEVRCRRADGPLLADRTAPSGR